MPRSFGPKKRTQADKSLAAMSVLLFRETLGEEEVQMLMRSYGQSEPQARALIAEERKRRIRDKEVRA
jgi:hypothetical protein